jgi:riboflavin kinase / FMN adenylyltransferase
LGPQRSVITIGTFDGVHRGHAALLARARAAADAAGPGTRAVALCFDPHPSTVLRPEATPARLTTFDNRAALLRDLGADEVVRLEPTREFLAQTPEAFVASLVERFAPVAFVEGPDFRFGRGRAGTLDRLRQLGRGHGFEVQVVEPVFVALDDCSVVAASSTIARWLLEHGRVRDATRVLGRPYSLAGSVVRGDRRGRSIGFPTANLDHATMAPADGVYAGLAHLDDGRRFAAAVSVGTKPTFNGSARAVEVFLLDASPSAAAAGSGIEGLPEYGWNLRLEMLGWVREQVRFDSVERLVEQMARDCARIRHIVSESTTSSAPAALCPPAVPASL